ncbi:hypothetical protein D3C79_1117440 [compost metagenome]
MLQLHTHLIDTERDLAQFVAGNFRNLVVELPAGNLLTTARNLRQIMIPFAAELIYTLCDNA